MGDLNIIKLDAKPLEKLIEVVSNGIGTIYRPQSGFEKMQRLKHTK